jgi:hypothetical protein
LNGKSAAWNDNDNVEEEKEEIHLPVSLPASSYNNVIFTLFFIKIKLFAILLMLASKIYFHSIFCGGEL